MINVHKQMFFPAIYILTRTKVMQSAVPDVVSAGDLQCSSDDLHLL